MDSTIETAMAIPKTLFDQVEDLAQHLEIPRNRLFEMALEDFIRHHQGHSPPDGKRSRINQGDIFWVQVDDPGGSEPGIPHPHVVIQDNVLNDSRLDTVVACALTSVIKRASLPGNVLLEPGEANLPRQSVVEVSKVSTVDKTQLGDYIGSLTEQRIDQIIAGLRFLQVSFFAR